MAALPAKSKRYTVGRALFLSLMVALTLSIHYMMVPSMSSAPHWLYLIHRRFCYVPIVLAGLWYGTWGGLGVALIISAATLPLVSAYSGPMMGNDDFIEIAFYLGIGTLTGLLVDRMAAEKTRAVFLQRKLDEQERLVSMGRMAAGIAHEIRTPLGSIQGAAEILAEDFEEINPKRPYFDIMIEEIRRLKAVVGDFLDLGRPLALASLDVGAAAAATAARETLGAQAREAGVEVQVDARQDVIAYADAFRLHQALTNLLRNAIQASPKGGRVLIKATSAQRGCLFEVEDQGAGIAPAQESRLYEPFYTSRADGTGLGLALVKRVAEAHGGWVRGESAAGGGARFSLWLPPPNGSVSKASHSSKREEGL